MLCQIRYTYSVCYDICYVHAIVCVLILFFSSAVADQQLNPLSSPVEERHLEEVLSNLRSEVKKRRLLMYPYYRDYDMVGGRGGEGRGGDEREREPRGGRGGEGERRVPMCTECGRMPM